MYFESLKELDCSGCGACSNICPVSAIEMHENNKGFYYPNIDETKCINCGKCREVCSLSNTHVGKDADPEPWAVCNRDAETVMNSSSGGFFSLLAEWIIGQNGVVYGAAFDESFNVKHSRATSIEEVKAFRQSKYVESDVINVYKSIEADLKADTIVLFSGTPCQVQGVKNYIRQRNISMENLYLLDIVCHGVPSRKVWKDYLDIVNTKIPKDKKIASVNMRSKRVSWDKQTFDIFLSDGTRLECVDDFSFGKIYHSLYITRESCFNCHFTSYERPGDFTAGDFWNLDSANLQFEVKNGVSMVLLNTEKAKTLFSIITDGQSVQKVDKSVSWQPHLEYSAKAPNQSEFWKEYFESEKREDVLRKYLKGSLLTRIIRIFTPLIRKLGLYKIAGKAYKKFIVRGKKNGN